MEAERSDQGTPLFPHILEQRLLFHHILSEAIITDTSVNKVAALSPSKNKTATNWVSRISEGERNNNNKKQ